MHNQETSDIRLEGKNQTKLPYGRNQRQIKVNKTMAVALKAANPVAASETLQTAITNFVSSFEVILQCGSPEQVEQDGQDLFKTVFVGCCGEVVAFRLKKISR